MIQINLEMPENCWQCPIMDGQDGYCRITNEDAPIDGKPESCPLQETKVRCIDCKHLLVALIKQRNQPDSICQAKIWDGLHRAPHMIGHDPCLPIRCDHFEKKEGQNNGSV